MGNKIKDYRKIREYCSNFSTYNIYDYSYFIGLTNVKEDIPDEDLLLLIDKCCEIGGEYTDPIEVGQSLANSIYEDHDITIEQIKNMTCDQFQSWYSNGREIGLPLEIEQETEEIEK